MAKIPSITKQPSDAAKNDPNAAELAAVKKANEDLQKQLADTQAASDKAKQDMEQRILDMEERMKAMGTNLGNPQPPVTPGVNPALQNPSQSDLVAGQPSKSLDDLMAEIQRQGGPKQATAPASVEEHNEAAQVITAKPSKKQMLEELARMYNTSPEDVEAMLAVDGGFKARPGIDPIPVIDLPLPEGAVLVPLKLKNDYWAGKSIVDQWPGQPDEQGNGGDNRFVAGSLIKLPGVEARRLINEGKAERADPLPDEA